MARPAETWSANYVSDDEAWEILEEQAQANLNMSARQFVEAWDMGKIENPDRPEIIDLVMLIPVAR